MASNGGPILRSSICRQQVSETALKPIHQMEKVRGRECCFHMGHETRCRLLLRDCHLGPARELQKEENRGANAASRDIDQTVTWVDLEMTQICEDGRKSITD